VTPSTQRHRPLKPRRVRTDYTPEGLGHLMRVLMVFAALIVFVAGVPLAREAEVVEVRGVARVGTRPVLDAVVWVDAPGAPPPTAAAAAPVLDQRNLEFFPRLLAVRVGTTVRFPNNDRVFHNVFSFKDGKKFDLGVYPIGAVKLVTFDRAGVSRLFCNIHPNMAAYVVAVDSPYVTTSDAAGRFVLQVPPGHHTWHAWRAGGPRRTGVIDATEGAPLAVEWP
jgi:plastocyanin